MAVNGTVAIFNTNSNTNTNNNNCGGDDAYYRRCTTRPVVKQTGYSCYKPRSSPCLFTYNNCGCNN